jgi:hypothetical protein
MMRSTAMMGRMDRVPRMLGMPASMQMHGTGMVMAWVAMLDRGVMFVGNSDVERMVVVRFGMDGMDRMGGRGWRLPRFERFQLQGRAASPLPVRLLRPRRHEARQHRTEPGRCEHAFNP